MTILEQKIRINPRDNLCEKMTKTQESVFNSFLENAESIEKDPKYNDEQHQIIHTKNGSDYYFDSCKYIYPIRSNGFFGVINNNIGFGEIASVSLYGNEMIRVEHFIKDNQMIRTIYECSENITNIPMFLLQVGSLHPVVLGKLDKLSEISFMKISNKIIGKDRDGAIIYSKPLIDSFYEEVILGVRKCLAVEDKQILASKKISIYENKYVSEIQTHRGK